MGAAELELELELLEGERVALGFARCAAPVQRCADGTFSAGKRCDGVTQCLDGSDETQCAGMVHPGTDPVIDGGGGDSLWAEALAL
eukprot:COSAG01_NODE_144_length_24108_cov_11.490441_25_plen_86_part_00